MNYKVFFEAIRFAFFLFSPLLLILIKVILQKIFKNLYDKAEDKVLDKMNEFAEKYKIEYYSSYDFLSKLREENYSSEEFNKDLNDYKRLFNRKNYFKKIWNFFDNIKIEDSIIYMIYAFLAGLFFLIGSIYLCYVVSCFFEQKELLGNNFAVIKTFDNYKEFPNWELNAKSICLSADNVNNKYFNIDGSLKKSEFRFILEENTAGLKPINTNEMWSEYLLMIEEKNKLLDAIK